MEELILSLASVSYEETVNLVSNNTIPLVIQKGQEEFDESEYPYYIDLGEYYLYDFIFDEGISKNEVTKIILNNDTFNIDNIYEGDSSIIIEANNQVIDINKIINVLI